MKLIDRIKQSLKNGYYCDCPVHRPKGTLLGFVGAYIGVSILLADQVLDGLPSLDEKQYCVVCHP